jgi:electron transport complex protein RnfB
MSVDAPSPSLADRIDALLPQTQCTKCGFAGCRPYAEAIASGRAELNQCPPGGSAGIAALAQLLGRERVPLNPANGVEGPRRVAVIDEQLCIGCTLCIDACPVDCIVGARRRMHTVIASQCTGCDLCVAPCPMDCIAMVPVSPARGWTAADASAARQRYETRNERRAHSSERNERRLADKTSSQPVEPDTQGDPTNDHDEVTRRKRAVEAALARARARRSGGATAR